MDRKILIVDDEKNIADIIGFNLKKEGYEVVKAADGEEGVAKAFSEKLSSLSEKFFIHTATGYIRS